MSASESTRRDWLSVLGLATLGLAGFDGGCAAFEPRTSVAAPPDGPARAERPIQLIPTELDVTARIDWARVRTAAPSSFALGALDRARLIGRGGGVLAWLLERTTTVWVGARPDIEETLAEVVWVLRGDFSDYEPRRIDPEGKWGVARDLGDGYRCYDRARQPIATRSEAVRSYAYLDELLVLVPQGSLDSVEYVLETGHRGGNLEPPEEGLISVSARPKRLAELLGERSPALARLLADATRLELVTDLDTREFSARLTLSFTSKERASRTALAARALQEELAKGSSKVSRLVSQARIEALDSALRLEARIALADLVELNRLPD